LSTGGQTEQGRAERKDLEIGAVDELLVGECVVRARDKEEKNITVRDLGIGYLIVPS
jgi:hypothetical protein